MESDKLTPVELQRYSRHLVLQDFGIGIPANELSRIKSPLFRGSKVQQIQGAGLGLPLVDRIMKVHDGHLEIISEEGVGTYCEISIPAED